MNAYDLTPIFIPEYTIPEQARNDRGELYMVLTDNELKIGEYDISRHDYETAIYPNLYNNYADLEIDNLYSELLSRNNEPLLESGTVIQEHNFVRDFPDINYNLKCKISNVIKPKKQTEKIKKYQGMKFVFPDEKIPEKCDFCYNDSYIGYTCCFFKLTERYYEQCKQDMIYTYGIEYENMYKNTDKTEKAIYISSKMKKLFLPKCDFMEKLHDFLTDNNVKNTDDVPCNYDFFQDVMFAEKKKK